MLLVSGHREHYHLDTTLFFAGHTGVINLIRKSVRSTQNSH